MVQLNTVHEVIHSLSAFNLVLSRQDVLHSVSFLPRFGSGPEFQFHCFNWSTQLLVSPLPVSGYLCCEALTLSCPLMMETLHSNPGFNNGVYLSLEVDLTNVLVTFYQSRTRKLQYQLFRLTFRVMYQVLINVECGTRLSKNAPNHIWAKVCMSLLLQEVYPLIYNGGLCVKCFTLCKNQTIISIKMHISKTFNVVIHLKVNL